jgi:hypothetical protein
LIHQTAKVMERIKRQAQFLEKGDVLATGEVVTHAPSRGLRTPSGKVDLGINGYLKTWNSRTEIVIKGVAA